jgi:hypothetical protein
MSHYPSIRILIDRRQPDYLIVNTANWAMLIANMSEMERQPVIFALATAEDKIAKAQEFFTVEVVSAPFYGSDHGTVRQWITNGRSSLRERVSSLA